MLCVTACGLLALGVDCAALQDIETRSLEAFEQRLGWAREDSCRKLEGWTVRVHQKRLTDIREHLTDNHGLRSCWPQGWWMSSIGICVSGYAHTQERVMEVMKDLGALTHEFLHALDHMSGRTLGHCGWQRNGRARAIYEVTGVWDDSDACEHVPRRRPR